MTRLTNVVKIIGRTVGVDVSRYRPVDRLRAAMIDEAGIDLVVDVGGHRGQYGSALRKFGYSSAIVSFEPLSEAFAELHRLAALDGGWTCHQVALGEEASFVRLNLAENLVSSSILDMLPVHARAAPESRYIGEEEVVMEPLDSFDLPPARSTMLKLDVQGYELHVLRGGTRFLKDVTLIECELSVAALYLGQPVLREMLNEIYGLGFDLIALEPGFYDPTSGARLQFDGFFGRR